MITSNSPIESFEPFARQQLIEWWDQRRLANAHVLVVGAGALGNEVLKNLALVGVGNIYIVDFDTVEPSNLSRSVLFRGGDVGQSHKAEVAAERVAHLHPYPSARVAYLHGDLAWEVGAGVYRGMDLVLGCLDNVEARRCVNMNCWKARKPWIDGAIDTLSGSIGFYTAADDLACYECAVTDKLRALANERYSCMGGVVRSKILNRQEPTTQTTSAIIAAIQTQEAIKICHGLEIPGGRKLYYHGLLHNFDVADPSVMSVTDLSLNSSCFCHAEDHADKVIVSDITTQQTADELLLFAERELGLCEPELVFGTFHPSAQGRRFAISASCGTCGYEVRLQRPVHQIKDVDVLCPRCPFTCPYCKYISMGEPRCPNCEVVDRPEMRLNTIYRVTRTREQRHTTLAALGIPELDVVRLIDDTHDCYVQLGQDLGRVFTSVDKGA